MIDPPPTPLPQQRLADAIRDLGDGFLVVVSGAGISLASGIPTFRGTDPDAVWQRDVTELGTNRFFQSDPVGSWRWYTSRFDQVLDKRPNPAHCALVALERWLAGRGNRFLLVTQNVDTLHEDAGARQLIKVHGSADRARCTRDGCENAAPSGSVARRDLDMTRFYASPGFATLPKCPACGGLLRQHVLWFDEFYDEHHDYQWLRVLQAAEKMDMALFVGTSFSVGVTDLFLQSGLSRGIPVYAIDPGARRPPYPAVTLLSEKCEVLLPAVCRSLQIVPEGGLL